MASTATSENSRLQQVSFPPFPSHSQNISIKLTSENYLVWKNMILNIVISNGLECFLEPSSSPPPQFLDNLLTNLIQITPYGNAEIWQSLSRLYASVSLARQYDLHSQLHSLQKGGLSVNCYVQKLQLICNQLAAVGEPVAVKDQLLILLNGLSSEYNPFVTSISHRSTETSIEEAHSLLLTYEARIEKQNEISLPLLSALPSLMPTSALLSSSRSSSAQNFQPLVPPNGPNSTRPNGPSAGWRPQGSLVTSPGAKFVIRLATWLLYVSTDRIYPTPLLFETLISPLNLLRITQLHSPTLLLRQLISDRHPGFWTQGRPTILPQMTHSSIIRARILVLNISLWQMV